MFIRCLRFAFAVMKHHDQKQLGEQRVCVHITSLAPRENSPLHFEHLVAFLAQSPNATTVLPKTPGQMYHSSTPGAGTDSDLGILLLLNQLREEEVCFSLWFYSTVHP